MKRLKKNTREIAKDKKEKPLKCLQGLCVGVPDFQISKIVKYSISNGDKSPFPHQFGKNPSYGVNIKDEKRKEEIANILEEKGISFFKDSEDAKNKMTIGSQFPNIFYQNLVNLEGKNSQITCNKGEITVMDFWTPWFIFFNYELNLFLFLKD